jgi:hypothetical protein
MPKESKRTQRPKRPKRIPTETTRGGFWHRIPLIGKLLSGVVLGVATLLGYLVVMPQIHTIKPSEPVDPYVPFDLPFGLENAGYFPLYDLKVDCTWDEFEVKDVGVPAGSPRPVKGPTIVMKTQQFEEVPLLASDEGHSFVCDVVHFADPDGIPNGWPVQRCNVKIDMSFGPIRFIDWRISRHFIFEAALGRDGKLHWSEPRLSPAE